MAARRFWGNIDPAEADASAQVEKAADYIRADLDVFSWNYTDFALYGREELDFIRCYEFTAFEDDHHFGRGRSTSFTHELSVDLLYADFTIPGDKHIYFVMTPDGTCSAKTGSAFSLKATDDSCTIRHKDGTAYLFSCDDSKVEQDIQTITYDGKYRIVSSTNSESTKTIEYDEYNRRVREDRPGGQQPVLPLQ